MNIDVEVTVESNPYGHTPGRNYNDVIVRVRQRRSGWSVNVKQVWGSCQGDDEEHGRIAIVGFGDELSEAISDADERAREAEINTKLLSQAISRARDKAEDAIEAVEEEMTN